MSYKKALWLIKTDYYRYKILQKDNNRGGEFGQYVNL